MLVSLFECVEERDLSMLPALDDDRVRGCWWWCEGKVGMAMVERVKEKGTAYNPLVVRLDAAGVVECVCAFACSLARRMCDV